MQLAAPAKRKKCETGLFHDEEITTSMKFGDLAAAYGLGAFL